MFKSLILGAVLGGITLFLWGAVSWMVMPWHMHGIHKFTDEAQVAQVLSDNAPASGIYLLPNALHLPIRIHPKSDSKERADTVARMQAGPYAFVSVTLEGMNPKKPEHYLYALAVDIVCALLVSWMLTQTQGLGYPRRVWFVTVVGLLIGIAAELPDWIWWRFSDNFTLIGLLDSVVGWLLAGVVIARCVTGQRPSLPTFR